jgi:photosystem II stability/assembly factor-like uncharacterized protein
MIEILAAALLLQAGQLHMPVESPGGWTTHGPGGGFVQQLVIDPSDPLTLYAGTGAGVFKTFDGGRSWIAISRGLPTSVDSLALDPQRPSTVYFSTLGDYLHGSRDYKSVDGGHTWTQMTSIVTGGFAGFPTPITALAVDPKSSDTLYAGATVPGYPGHPESQSFAELHKSVDGGRSWQQLFSVPGGVGQILVDREDSATVYSIMDFKVYKSADAGLTWGVASPPNVTYVTSLAQSASNPPDLFAGTAGQGVFRSGDVGLTWEPINNGFVGDALAVDSVAAASPSIVYAATYAGVFRSEDNGSSWRQASLDRRGRITVDLLHTSTLYAIPVLDNTRTFDGVEGFNALGITAIAVSPSTDTILYAGAFRRVFKSVDQGQTWAPHEIGSEGFFALVLNLIFDPFDSQTLYAATTDGPFQSRDGGNSWVSIRGDLSGNDPYDASLAADPRAHGRLFSAAEDGKVFRTEDRGVTWVAIGPSATDDGDNFNGLISLDSESGVLYFGSVRGLFRSEDLGATWQQTSIQGPVYALELAPSSPATIYAGSSEGLFRSIDAGLTWKPISSAPTSPDGPYAMAIAINPKRLSEVAIVVPPLGVYRSEDGGATWLPFNDGLTLGPLVSDGPGHLTFGSSGKHLFGAGVGVLEHAIGARETRDLPPRPVGKPAASERVR